MLIYLDTVVVIYAIEGAPAFKTRALDRLKKAHDAGDDVVTSHLTLAECLVLPIRNADAVLEAEYRMFLSQTLVKDHPVDVFEELSRIRAASNVRIPDALHLATAMHHRCDLFLTNDDRLAAFKGIPVEKLP